MRRAALGLLLGACATALSAATLSLPQSDGFGYVASSVPFGWTDISGSGVPITSTVWVPNADDGAVQVDLPFNFRFYGTTYTKVYLSTNGYIQFGSSSAAYAPNCLNLNTAPLNIAAAYWMDLDPSAGGTVHKEVLGLTPNRAMVLQFTNVPPRLGSGSLTFQILIYENNSIDFVYISTSTHDGGASAVAGLRSAFDCPNHLGLPLSCQQAVLGDSTAVHIAYPGVEPGCGTPTNTVTPSLSPTFSQSFTRSDTPTISPTFSHTSSITPSFSESPSVTLTPTFTVTDSYSQTFTETGSSTPSPTLTETPSITVTSTESPSATPTASETPSVTASFSASPSVTATPSITPTASVTPTATASPSLSASPSATRTATASNTPSATPSATATATPTSSATPSVTATPSISPTRTITTTGTASPTFTPTFTSTCTLLPAPAKPACLVLGQSNYLSNTASPASASSLGSADGIALDTRVTPFRLYVSDRANHRVLFWNNASLLTLGSPADGVIGQASFSGSSSNQGGAVSASTLSNPTGLAVDPLTGALWVSDTGNHRVLHYSLPLSATGSTADAVLGQGGSFTSATVNQGGLSASSLKSPTGLSCNDFGSLIVADSGNHRVLRFLNPSSSAVANASWGQGGNFNSNTANLGGLGPQTLNSPTGVLFLANQIWVSDSGNHRVLRYDLGLPLSQNPDILLGQPNYFSNSANRGFGLTADDRFDGPQGLGVDISGRLLVADTNNHRVIAFEPPYQAPAVLVWGQSSLGTKFPGTGNDSLTSPSSIAVNAATLAVADSGNYRVLVYGCGAGLQPTTPTPTYTPTSSGTPTCTISATSTVSPTQTLSLSASPSFSASPTKSLTFTRTITETFTDSPTVTPSFSASPTYSPTVTPSITTTLSPSHTAPPTFTPYPRTADEILSYPNPASRRGGRACFAFPPAASARVELYDLLGQPVASLDGAGVNAGQGTACWDLRAADGSVVAPGQYFVRIVSDGQARLAKLTIAP